MKRNKDDYAREARKNLEERFKSLPVFQRARSLAVYHYAAVLEEEAYTDGAQNRGDQFRSHRQAVESSAWAIPAIWRRCSEDPEARLELDRKIFGEARELFDFTWRYENIEYAFTLADRGQFEIFVAKREPTITFTYASAEADLRDTNIRAREMQRRAGPQDAVDIKALSDRLVEVLQQLVSVTGGDHCEYQYTEELFTVASEYGKAKLRRTNSFHVPPDIPIGDLTFSDLQAFWAALIAITNIHTGAHVIASARDLTKLPIETVVHCRPYDEFRELVGKVSGLGEKASPLLKWYTYDPQIAKDLPILQPFIPVTGNRLLLPTLFINGNAFERNFRKLLYRHPELRHLATGLDQRLENAAIEELSTLFPKPGFITIPRAKIPGTDIDLLIFETASESVLCVQHKFLIPPDTLLESAANDEKIGQGVHQARIARQFLRSDQSALRSRLGLKAQAPVNAVVVCRGLETTGFVPKDEIPVVAERDFVSLWPKSQTLSELQKSLTTRPDQAAAVEQSAELKVPLELCGYRFLFPGLAVPGAKRA